MKRLPTLAAALLAVVLCGGCSHIPFFGKKNPDKASHKNDSKVASQSETEFETRWVAKRSSELISQGLSQDAAKAQAVTEFKEKFSATHMAQP